MNENRSEWPAILVIEDNPAQMKTLCDILAEEELRPVACASGEAALEAVGHEDVHVAILDLRLPDFDGLDLLSRLKDRRPGIKIIVNTGFATLESAMGAMNREAFAYVQKMGSVDELLRHIHRAFHSHLADYSLRLRETVRKQTREANISKETARRYLQLAGTMIVSLNRHGDILLINRKGCDILGYAQNELLGKNWFDTCLPREIVPEIKTVFHQSISCGSEVTGSYVNPVVTKEGEERIIHWNNTLLRDDDGRVEGVLCSGEDITRLKQKEAELEKSLAEKDVLLRELYHRTKNNMNVISSLLGLQSLRIQDGRMRDILEDTIGRIKSMALVHAKLYQSGDLSSINLKEYIIDLSELLLAGQNDRGNIRVSNDLDDVQVLIDIAIPCGMIVNELLSNSLKYGFPDGREGVIDIRLKANGQGDVELCVADDGVGVPDGFDFRNTDTLGLETVVGLGENQIRGTVEFLSENGFTCVFRFNKDNLYVKRV